MADMRKVIEPKSDQINAEDFLAGPKTYTIAGVDIKPGQEQPVNIYLHGEKRAWRPCKSVCRLLVAAWGADASQYAGKSVTLYLDPKVKWGGMEVGGIRVSHMSHIERDMVMALTATRGKKVINTVKPLKDAPKAETTETPDIQAHAREVAKGGVDALREFWKTAPKDQRHLLDAIKDELLSTAEEADANSGA